MSKPTTAFRTAAFAAGACTIALLVACGDDSRTVGAQVDQAIVQSERQVEQATDALKQGAERAADAVGDAAITAAVSARLAADDRLSVLQIEVDTTDGRVALTGQAPDEAARQRAAELAAGVDGVRAVDNRLTVASS
jgi:osmotically-inducible protein OsmY